MPKLQCMAGYRVTIHTLTPSVRKETRLVIMGSRAWASGTQMVLKTEAIVAKGINLETQELGLKYCFLGWSSMDWFGRCLTQIQACSWSSSL